MNAATTSQQGEVRLRDQQAASYDQWIAETKGPYFDLVDRSAPLRWLNLSPSHRVFDAGCGTGRLTIPLAKRCTEVWAADFSPKSIEVLSGKLRDGNLPNVKTMVADLANVALPEAYFDRAVSNSVIHHIPSAESRAEAVKRIYTSLKPGGVFVVMVFRWGGSITFQKEYWTDTEGGKFFRMGFTGEELRALLEGAGFRDVKVGGLFNFRPRGLSKLPFLLRVYAALDLCLARCAFSARRGKHLLARGVK